MHTSSTPALSTLVSKRTHLYISATTATSNSSRGKRVSENVWWLSDFDRRGSATVRLWRCKLAGRPRRAIYIAEQRETDDICAGTGSRSAN